MNKPHGESKLIAMNVLLPHRMMQALDKQAVREGNQSRAAIIRRACAEYLERHAAGNPAQSPAQEAA